MHSLKYLLLVIAACVFGVSSMPQGLGDVSNYVRSEGDASHLAQAQKKRMQRKRTTNGERFASGMPPLPPRKLFDATHVDTAARARRSATGTTFTCPGLLDTATCCAGGVFSGDGEECSDPGNPASTATCYGNDTPACCEGVSGGYGDTCTAV